MIVNDDGRTSPGSAIAMENGEASTVRWAYGTIPHGSGMNFSEHSGAPAWGGGYAQGAHLRMFPHL